MKRIFTFGVGQKHRGKYVVIEDVSRETCRDEMIRRFGMNWAHVYDYHMLNAIKDSGLTELKE